MNSTDEMTAERDIVPAKPRGVWVHDAQAEGSGDGRVHAGALLVYHVEAQRGAACHVRHHSTLVKYLQKVFFSEKTTAICLFGWLVGFSFSKAGITITGQVV